MSRVRTTEQARGLQRCSTHPCIVCGARSRLYLEEFATTKLEVWRDFWATVSDGSVTIKGHEIRLAVNDVCRKHKVARGVFVEDRGHGQFARVVILERSTT